MPTDTLAVAMTRHSVVDMIEAGGRDAGAVKRAPELGTTAGRRAILARLGVTADTPDDYRLVMFQDSTTSSMLVGRQTPSGSIAVDRCVSLDGNPEQHAKTSQGRHLIDNWLLRAPLRTLPRAITIPPNPSPKQPGELSSEAVKALRREITLLASAERAVQTVAQSGTANDLPPPGPTRGAARGA
jgi:hypothetical protein